LFKAFSGHGNTNVDSHLGLPILEENLEQLLENELYPFMQGIAHKVDSIMIGHLAVPALHNGDIHQQLYCNNRRSFAKALKL
jgi:beta-glucosidase-like glycosyl hydrolase